MNENVALFVATLFHSGTNAHFFHLSSNSYSQHKALGNFYEDIIELADDKTFVNAASKDLPQEQALINIVAEIQQLIDSTLYKLRFLK